MQPDLIGANETKEIDSNIFRKPLQFRRRDVAGKDHLDEHGRIVAPVDADMVIDPLHERIARVPRSQAIDPARNFLAGGPFTENDRHPDFSCSSIPRGGPAFRIYPATGVAEKPAKNETRREKLAQADAVA